MALPDRRAGPPVEEVLVIPRGELEAAGLLRQGFTAEGVEDCLRLVAGKGRFLSRPQAEEDPSFKQIIPYAVLAAGRRVFLFRRSARGGEARLHHKLSIGVGGHINPEGVPPGRLVAAGLERELSEELLIATPYRYRAAGLINDDALPVGRVHLGIVYEVAAREEGVQVREEEILAGAFVEREELRRHLGSMESWSRMVAEALYLS